MLKRDKFMAFVKNLSIFIIFIFSLASHINAGSISRCLLKATQDYQKRKKLCFKLGETAIRSTCLKSALKDYKKNNKKCKLKKKRNINLLIMSCYKQKFRLYLRERRSCDSINNSLERASCYKVVSRHYHGQRKTCGRAIASKNQLKNLCIETAIRNLKRSKKLCLKLKNQDRNICYQNAARNYTAHRLKCEGKRSRSKFKSRRNKCLLSVNKSYQIGLKYCFRRRSTRAINRCKRNLMRMMQRRQSICMGIR